MQELSWLGESGSGNMKCTGGCTLKCTGGCTLKCAGECTLTWFARVRLVRREWYWQHELYRRMYAKMYRRMYAEMYRRMYADVVCKS